VIARLRRHSQGFFHAESAVVAGDVQVGRDVSIWFGAVVRGDVCRIELGDRVNVQDGAIIHGDTGNPLVKIEADVSIGHAAIVHCRSVGAGSLVGMGSRLLDGVVVGRECIIAAGAVVPPGTQVPDRSLVLGVPGRVARLLTERELAYIRWIPPHYVELAQKWVRGEFRDVTAG
jgi:carbonic anhydrase/acetyltransferase-like protein (isoleucine patch superfamily)